MNIFAYGTLMYPELLAQLTKKEWQMTPATLHGYRRCILLKEGFGSSPIIVPDKNASVTGKILYNVDPETLNLLDAYECVDQGIYARKSVTAICKNSNSIIDVECYEAGSSEITFGGIWNQAQFESAYYEHFKTHIIPEFLSEYFSS